MDEQLKRRIVDAICEEWERTGGDLEAWRCMPVL